MFKIILVYTALLNLIRLLISNVSHASVDLIVFNIYATVVLMCLNQRLGNFGSWKGTDSQWAFTPFPREPFYNRYP